nr:MAG TPA: hypothetical protein [Caudoviricetes sp.]
MPSTESLRTLAMRSHPLCVEKETSSMRFHAR